MQQKGNLRKAEGIQENRGTVKVRKIRETGNRRTGKIRKNKRNREQENKATEEKPVKIRWAGWAVA